MQLNAPLYIRRLKARAMPFSRTTIAIAAAVATAPATAATTSSAWSFEAIRYAGAAIGGAYSTRPVAIIDSGLVTGAALTTVSGGDLTVDRGFVWNGEAAVTPVYAASRPSASFRVVGITANATVYGSDNSYPGNASYQWLPGGYSEPSLVSVPTGWTRINGVSADGTVVGRAEEAGLSYRYFVLTPDGQVQKISPVYVTQAGQQAVGNAGHVAYTAFNRDVYLWRDGVSTQLPKDLSSALSSLAVNSSGVVVGTQVYTGGTTSAVSWSGGTQTVLAATGGQALGINDMGLVVGALNGKASVWVGSGATLLDTAASGSLPPGVSLITARAVNTNGQIVGDYTSPGVLSEGYRLTMRTDSFIGASGSRWDDRTSWASGVGPLGTATAFVDPVSSRTLFGPTGSARVGQLVVGTSSSFGPTGTLSMIGGSIDIVGPSDPSAPALDVRQRGVLSGQGTLNSVSGSAFHNQGRIVAGDLSFSGAVLANFGTIEGSGIVAADSGLSNTGLIRPTGAGQLSVRAAIVNSGRMESFGGSRIEVDHLTNTAQGRVSLAGGQLAGGPIVNAGRIDVGSGSSQITGPLFHSGIVVVSGFGQAAFWDDVETSGEIRVSGGSTATFFGSVTLLEAAAFTGSGTTFFEYGFGAAAARSFLSLASSGNVSFGRSADVRLRLGTVGGDRLGAAGLLSLDGTLRLKSEPGEMLQAGQRFDVLSWGDLSGRFAFVDTTGLTLASGARLDMSNLYVDGSVSVVPVPEPRALALWLAGLAGLMAAVGRRRATLSLGIASQ